MDQTPGTWRSIWRFSLRELFLVMLVAAAFLGWGVSFYPHYIWKFQPSKFFVGNGLSRQYSVEWETDVKEICAELGEPVPERIAVTITNNDGPEAARRTMYFRFALPTEKRKALADALVVRVKDRLQAAGGKYGGAANGSMINETRTMTYQCGPLGGACDICVTEGPPEKVCLIVNMCEMKGPIFVGGRVGAARKRIGEPSMGVAGLGGVQNGQFAIAGWPFRT